MVDLECEFFASEATPRPGYEAGDIWAIPVEELGGELVCTVYAILQYDDITFFDMRYTEVPENELEDDQNA